MTKAAPCVGCGYCCIVVPCVHSLARYGLEDCPALQWGGNRYRCALANELAEELAIGEGCTSELNSWRRDVRCRDSQRRGRQPIEKLEAEAAAELQARFLKLWPELGHYLAAVVRKEE